MKAAILQPLIYGSGISLFLYAHNQQLTIGSYISPLPFWIFIGRPLGMFWNNNVLKELNKDIFPADMKNYRELYLVSRRAITYDIMFNHLIFHPLLSFIVIGYSYMTKRI